MNGQMYFRRVLGSTAPPEPPTVKAAWLGQFRRIITVGAGGAPPAAETMGSTRVDWKSRNDITRVPPILRFLCPSPRRGSGSSRIHCKMKLPVRDLQLGGGIGGLSVSFAETPAMKMTQGRWRGLMGERLPLSTGSNFGEIGLVGGAEIWG